MRALVYTGTMASEMRAVPEPEPAPGEVIVEISHCGICGSDMHAWHGHDPRRVPPMVLGHEAVGIARGGSFDGKRVAINPLVGCGVCAACRSGREHLCPDRDLLGLGRGGAFTERVAVPERNLHHVPDHLSFEQAALAEPLAVCVHAVEIGRRTLVRPVSELRCVVLGGGAIGLLTALVLARQGCSDLWIAETNPVRRELLEAAVRCTAYDPRHGGPEPASADLVMDAVGLGATRASSCVLATPGGTIVHIGLQESGDGLDTRQLTLQEITFAGTYCYADADFAAAVTLLADGLVDNANWIDVRPLEAGAQGFIDIHEGRAPPKIVLQVA